MDEHQDILITNQMKYVTSHSTRIVKDSSHNLFELDQYILISYVSRVLGQGEFEKELIQIKGDTAYPSNSVLLRTP